MGRVWRPERALALGGARPRLAAAAAAAAEAAALAEVGRRARPADRRGGCALWSVPERRAEVAWLARGPIGAPTLSSRATERLAAKWSSFGGRH